jgi:hypothetical protein
MSPSKSLGVFWPKLDAPQSDRFVVDRDCALGHEIFDVTSTQIEAVIKPDRVLNDLRRETVSFVHRCRLVHSTIVIQTCSTCQYQKKQWNEFGRIFRRDVSTTSLLSGKCDILSSNTTG